MEKGLKLRKKIYNFLIVLFIISLYILLNVFFYNNTHGDLGQQQEWGNLALKNTISYLYLNKITDYPPLSNYIFMFNSWLNYRLYNNADPFTAHYIIISKIIPILCNILISLFIFFYILRSDLFKSNKFLIALFSMMLYLFNFSIIYNTSVWAQVDSIYTFVLLVSLILLLESRFLFSTLFLSLGLMLKTQSLFFVPIVWFQTLKNKSFRSIKIIVLNILLFLLIFIQFLLNGSIFSVIATFFSSFGKWHFVSMNAYNLWFFLFPVSYDSKFLTPSDNLTFFGITYKFIGLFLFAIYCFFVLYQINKKKDKESLVIGAASLAFAFFMLPTEMHERFLFPFFAIFSLLVLKNKKYFFIYLVLSMTYLVNMMTVLNYHGGFFVYSLIQSVIDRILDRISLNMLGFFVSLINLLTFFYFSKIGIFKGLIVNLRSDIITLFN